MSGNTHLLILSQNYFISQNIFHKLKIMCHANNSNFFHHIMVSVEFKENGFLRTFLTH